MIEKHKNILIYIFFFLVLASGIFQTGDYGTYPDDGIHTSYGYLTYSEVTSFFEGRSFSTIPDSDCPEFGCAYVYSVHVPEHAPDLEFIFVFIEKIFNPQGTYETYQLRHFLVFLLFFAGLIFFYKLCKQGLRSWKLGLLACVFLVLSPRIFADAHYNSSDIGAMVSFIFASYAFLKYREKKDLGSLLFSSLITAIAIDTRATALIFIPLTLAYLFLDVYNSKNSKEIFSRKISLTVLYAAITPSLIFIFWPHLWENPLNIVPILKATFGTFNFEVKNLYYSDIISSTKDHPALYDIVWIGITTPILYLFLSIFGFIKIARDIFTKNILKTIEEHTFEIVAAAFFIIPLASAILFKKAFYNGWRHLYFIYPFFIIISVIGFTSLKDTIKRINVSLIPFYYSFVSIALIFICINMISIHPYEYAFFNSLAPRMDNVCVGFDKDYYRISVRQEIKFLLRSKDKVRVAFLSGYPNLILPESEKGRVLVIDKTEADYLIVDNDFEKTCDPASLGKVIRTIYVNDVPISYIVKLH